MTKDIPSDELFAAKLRGIEAYLLHRDYLHERALPDGRGLFLMHMLGNNLRIGISPPNDRVNFSAGYCYHDHDAAWRCALGWDGQDEPEGWYRHLQSGRRRPDGTAASEFIAP